jgi:hypothetical protein
MLFMLFLVTSGVALAIGFVLGRIWEIRLGIEWQTASDSARLPSTSSDRVFAGRAQSDSRAIKRDPVSRCRAWRDRKKGRIERPQVWRTTSSSPTEVGGALI